MYYYYILLLFTSRDSIVLLFFHSFIHFPWYFYGLPYTWNVMTIENSYILYKLTSYIFSTLLILLLLRSVCCHTMNQWFQKKTRKRRRKDSDWKRRWQQYKSRVELFKTSSSLCFRFRCVLWNMKFHFIFRYSAILRYMIISVVCNLSDMKYILFCLI